MQSYSFYNFNYTHLLSTPDPGEGVERDGAVKTTKRGDKFGIALSVNKLCYSLLLAAKVIVVIVDCAG